MGLKQRIIGIIIIVARVKTKVQTYQACYKLQGVVVSKMPNMTHKTVQFFRHHQAKQIRLFWSCRDVDGGQHENSCHEKNLVGF
ncbi:hypothetical protein BDV24DRAFT_138425 [Aspergillus arachidicola]|uniref:Uncharacterized protein n=1 Tax=Aspergillus arachidicola TaxID=656916 RepID=A0A5N6Y167_9EURO|nr:hypothetical protein BDV24DRAFT_138425 [Aspergillus arachidicola]